MEVTYKVRYDNITLVSGRFNREIYLNTAGIQSLKVIK